MDKKQYKLGIIIISIIDDGDMVQDLHFFFYIISVIIIDWLLLGKILTNCRNHIEIDLPTF